MRHLTSLFVLSLFFAFSSLAQTGSVKGKIINSKTAEPIENVKVLVVETAIETHSNQSGEFVMHNVPAGEGTLELTKEGYEPKSLNFKLSEGELLDIGSVSFVYAPALLSATEELPMVVLEESDLEEETSQAMSGMLHSSGDVFSSISAYTFGAVRFRTRGYDSENSAIYFNGIEMNNPESGRVFYSDWGGLNEVLRNKEIYFGQENNDFTQSYLGGGANVITRPSQYRPGVNVSYMNRLANYKHRAMATYSTGLLDNNWAFTLSGSRRWAEEGYVEGTFYDAWALFIGIEKIINEKHSVSLTGFVTPNKRGKQIGAPQELYDLENNVFYNANWGYQNGEKRNSRVANSFKPYFMLNHIWDVNEKMKVNSTLAYSFGRNGNTALTWGDARDPRPTYYRYLPSYNNSDPTYEWMFNQVDWDGLYAANSDEHYYVEDANGIEGNDVYEIRSKYMIEDRRIDHSQITANVNVKYDLTEELGLTAIVNYTNYKGRHFKLVDDLLGGDFWLDIDKFALGDVDNPDQLQSDLNNPNRLAKEGDVFGYDYDANISKIGGHIKADYTVGNLDVYLAGGVSNTIFYRTGNMQVGNFPDNSYGDSEKQKFFNYNINAGATYKITGRHIAYANASYMTRAPYFDESYISPRTRDNVVDGLTSEKIMSFDVNYLARMPYLTGRFSAFYTTFQDQTDVMSFYHDDYKNFVNYAMTGIDKKHFGAELGLEGKITSEFSFKAAATMGQYTWDSRPNVSITRDNNSQSLATNETVYVQDYRVDGTPQSAYSLGLSYRSPKYWWIEVNANYFDNTYLSFNPARRTAAAIEGVDVNSELAEDILAQEKLPAAFTVNLTGGKSWRFDKYYLRLFATVNNVLDNREAITGGYEQLRFDYADHDVNKFSPVYFYMYGRSYMLILTLSF